MKKILVIMRGVPGSGKSFVAEAIQAQTKGVICSTDKFFMVEGEYKFDFAKLGLNHRKCQNQVEEYMVGHEPSIIVDNTNTTQKEMQPYLDLAHEYGYNVQTVEVGTDLDTCVSRNQHGVPVESIRKMQQRLNEDKPLW